MKDSSFTLLIHDNTEPLEPLKEALLDLAVDTFNVHNLDVAKTLRSEAQPQVIFIDTGLPEEAWAGVFSLVERADVPLNIIVMGTSTHLERYLSAMGRRSFNLVVPPFVLESLGYVIRSNALEERIRPDAPARAAYV